LAKASNDAARYIRLHEQGASDKRREAARDRDRVMYCGAFKRLGGVTQVASAFGRFVFHTRLSHTLEVAQIGRRIAENLSQQIESSGGLPQHVDPDVVEAAALIHDLGHPPFGHVAEEELNRLAVKERDLDGFDGNAQSFRVITRLSAHRSGYEGLNLCRATLNASLKYPYYARSAQAKKKGKYGAYASDSESFDFARQGQPKDQTCMEADILDYADDVAYSVHDVEDFYRAGLLPLDRLLRDQDEFDDFMEAWKVDKKHAPPTDIDDFIDKIKDLLDPMLIHATYAATRDQRTSIRTMTSFLIKRFVEEVVLTDKDGSPKFQRTPLHGIEIAFLQSAIWHYVISDARIATQRPGQRAIVKVLFDTYLDAIRSGQADIIPGRFRHVFEEISQDKAASVRLAVDIVASLTDLQAVALSRRFTGQDLGDVSDIVVW
jgi:dGTPase